MSPSKAVFLGLLLNVSAVLVMERVKELWRGGTPWIGGEAWVWYVVIAVAIVGAQFCIIKASLAEAFPMYAVLSIFIAFVMAFSMLNGCRASGRWPTIVETLTLVAFLATAFLFQYVSARAERIHQARGDAELREN